MTTLINIYAGPGAGKSTLASGVFHQLKLNHASVELVHEAAKEMCWHGDPINAPWDEFYLFGCQVKSEGALYGKVDYIVAERPLGLSLAYVQGQYDLLYAVETMFTVVKSLRRQHGVKTIDLHVIRNSTYQQQGRYHDEEQALDIDAYCRRVFPGPVVTNVGDVIRELNNEAR
jgi:hypothetical protein